MCAHGSDELIPSTDALLPAGKLPPALLAALLHDLPTEDPALVLGPTVGEDAAVIDFVPEQDRLLVAKSDPITFATDEIGFYAVNVCANDLAVVGATPRFYLPTVLLPAGETDGDLARRIFRQIGAACRQLGVVVAGGHSEITHTVKQPVVAGTMLGEVARARLVRSGGCQVGDDVLLVGSIPIEGASILAREKGLELIARGWSPEEIEDAANYLHNPGISVLSIAATAAATGLVHSMHDPTEGGVVTGLLEIALAGDVGMTIDLDAILIPQLARRLCSEFGLDPLGVIVSGALLATATPTDVPVLRQAWSDLGYPVNVIGRVTAAGEGLVARRGGQTVPFPSFPVDEITKLFG